MKTSQPDLEAPPAYTPAYIPSYLPSNDLYAAAEILSTLHDLPEQLNQIHSDRATNLFLAHVAPFLVIFRRQGLPRGRLILCSSSTEGVPCDLDYQSQDEYVKVERVQDGSTRDEDDTRMTNSSAPYEWNETTGRYWNRPEVAARLKDLMEPMLADQISTQHDGKADVQHPPATSPSIQPAALAHSQEIITSGKSFWRKKSASMKGTAIRIGSRSEAVVERSRVSLDVNTEEVTFRTQTPLGIFGTQTATAIVVVVKVHQEEGER